MGKYAALFEWVEGQVREMTAYTTAEERHAAFDAMIRLVQHLIEKDTKLTDEERIRLDVRRQACARNIAPYIHY